MIYIISDVIIIFGSLILIMSIWHVHTTVLWRSLVISIVTPLCPVKHGGLLMTQASVDNHIRYLSMFYNMLTSKPRVVIVI